MILAAKFTQKAPDSMNFVNFAGKKLYFQGRRRAREAARRRRRACD
jgi:hypothetical protein